jgi:hypothetical protein
MTIIVAVVAIRFGKITRHHITSPPLAMMMLPEIIFSIVVLRSFNTPFALIFEDYFS